MADWKEFFRNKKITVLGLGLLGRGIGDVAFLAECGAELTVTDKKTEDELRSSLHVLGDIPNITYILGEHRMKDFEGRDMILVAAGVPLDSPYVAHARERGISVHQSAALFTLLSEVPVIGVTGTRGKSTVTHMIHHALTETTGEHIILGGNVRGVSNLQLLKEVREDSLAVMELDSWQLQGFGWAKISPQIAVFTNFMEDHMNYYQKDDNGTTPAPGSAAYVAGMDAYFNDKAQIFMHQSDGDTLITTQEVFERIKRYCQGDTLAQEVVLVDESTLPDEVLLRIPGAHNRLNAALAFEALRAVGLTDEEALQGLASFRGVEGRLEYLGDMNGVAVYNDNNSTTPQATIAGITALAKGRNIILIAGGAYKGISPTPLLTLLDAHCKKVVLLPGTGTEKLVESKGHTLPVHWRCVDSLEEAVRVGLEETESGDVLLFSPGFASFGLFKNEYDRNDQFLALVHPLTQHGGDT